MTIIYKYQLPTYHDGYSRFTVLIPDGFIPLKIGGQEFDNNDIPVLWAIVDTDNEMKEVEFSTIGTGIDAGKQTELILKDNSWSYIDTYQIGNFVGHVFYEKTD